MKFDYSFSHKRLLSLVNILFLTSYLPYNGWAYTYHMCRSSQLFGIDMQLQYVCLNKIIEYKWPVFVNSFSYLRLKVFQVWAYWPFKQLVFQNMLLTDIIIWVTLPSLLIAVLVIDLLSVMYMCECGAAYSHLNKFVRHRRFSCEFDDHGGGTMGPSINTGRKKRAILVLYLYYVLFG